MENQDQYKFGSVIMTPAIEEEEKMKWVFSVDPEESIPLIGKYTLSRMQRGIARYPWQVQYGKEVIDCRKFINLSPQQITRCTWIGEIEKDYFDDLRDAQHFVEGKSSTI